MNNHNKILRISIIVMLLTLIISIISISKLRIENQVFLKNYYEIAVSEYEGTYSFGQGCKRRNGVFLYKSLLYWIFYLPLPISDTKKHETIVPE